MNEEASGAPEELLAGAPLFLGEGSSHGVQRGVSSISTNLCELRSCLGLFAARVLRGSQGGGLGLLSLGD
jgi:hypothetical protein